MDEERETSQEMIDALEKQFHRSWLGTRWHLTKRWFRFKWQMFRRGWTDEDTWNLDHVIAEFAYPRLVRFKEVMNGFPHGVTWEEWKVIVDDMIYAFWVSKNEWDLEEETVDWARMQRGFKYFGQYYRSLWW